jgi:carboxyl-terminal processing protease
MIEWKIQDVLKSLSRRSSMVRKFVFTLLLVLLALSLIGIGYFIGYLDRAASDDGVPDYALLEEAHELLVDNYFGEIPELVALQRGMIQGMVDKIEDPFTTFVEPVANELQADDLMGRFGGIGGLLTRDESGNVHIIPFPEGPAAEAGILEEFRLIAVEGTSISQEMSNEKIISLIRGEIGTLVKLTFQIDGLDEPKEFNLSRVEFEIPSVTSYMLPSKQEIGVVFIQRFSDRTMDELESAFETLGEEGIEGLVLDLRGNTGGLLDAAIDVARFFLDNGIVLIQTERDGQIDEYKVRKPGTASEIPLVLLIDAGTASASEVVAAALRENDRAQLVGARSYGKGSVQSVLALSDGSSLHVTIARWLTPSRISIDAIGLEPDISVPISDTGKDEILEVGVSLLLDLMKE